ncbi:MAG: NAD-dependent epimerase/dehydratase family protein [Lachnospiraceae bacterium]|nr:NAD-dependent epimerase/dehydratase family protein [Lachnospiraceae bacterium]
MRVYENQLYREDIEYVSNLDLTWDLMKDSSILISGASGLVGSCLIDVIMHKNAAASLNCTVYALGRNEAKAKERFQYCWEDDNFFFISHDINAPLEIAGLDEIGYVLHMASNTHPVAYATDPIGTVTTNIIGTNNMLEFAVNHNARRFAFASSNEIYGENRGDVEFFDEHYCGYIDSNTMRAGYPESKRCGEALCQAYIKQKGIDVVIPRLTRSYGPTMLMSDTKAISQFIRKGVAGEDIVLKSAGTQYYSYTYVADAVAGLLTVLLKGECGSAYNIADESGDIMLKDLAEIIAQYSGKKVVFELPDDVEKSGYSTATKARLDGSKLKRLGWETKYAISEGLFRTISILREL